MDWNHAIAVHRLHGGACRWLLRNRVAFFFGLRGVGVFWVKTSSEIQLLSRQPGTFTGSAPSLIMPRAGDKDLVGRLDYALWFFLGGKWIRTRRSLSVAPALVKTVELGPLLYSLFVSFGCEIFIYATKRLCAIMVKRVEWATRQ